MYFGWSKQSGPGQCIEKSPKLRGANEDTTWVERVVALDITYHCAHKVKSDIHS
jgi:hypothetical protein